MELFPALKIDWLNGWILLAFEFLIQGTLLLVFPRPVVRRLFDRSGWSAKQRLFTILGKVFSLVCLVLIILTPIKINAGLFIAAMVLYAIGIAALVTAMLNFKATPPNQPVRRGLYQISRHPQIVSLFIIFFGIGLALGSWAVLITLILSRAFQHFGILAEEEVCLKQYGESYSTYMKRIPRYFLFL
ncbi:MAG: DUF1295 domain-containing protein [Anaerolineales bacterium]|jgi:protein-S-isoprenylcysteine O-methyltransferase Ste14|nr:DUF1295 domain-containing protein [Anaerolineales bacterium]